MPVLLSRPLSTVLRIALGALSVDAALAVRDLVTEGGSAPVVRLVSWGVVAVGIVMALRRHRELEQWTRERQQVEDELRASEQRFAGILSIAVDSIISVDESFRIVHFNRGAEDTFGYTAEEAAGRPLTDLIPARYRGGHGDHMAMFARAPERARRMGERREIFGLRNGGEEFPAEASISKLELPGGRLLFTVVLRDITTRKRVEDDERFLSESAATLSGTLSMPDVRQLVADLPVPRIADAALVDWCEDDGSFTRVTSQWHRESLTPALRALATDHPLTAESPWPAVDVLRRGSAHLVEAVDDDWLEAHEENAAAVAHWRSLGAQALLLLPLQVGDRPLGVLTLVSTAPGRRFGADEQAVAAKFASLASVALENARLYEAAQRANRARDEVLGVVSHDLRNPLSAIAMCARVLRHSPPDDPAARDDLLGTISQSTEWMKRLIQDLLDVASIDRGQLSLERQREPVDAMVTAAVGMFGLEAHNHGLALEEHVEEGMPPVLADADRVTQVLGNLLRNAVKFTPDGGRITVAARRQGDLVELSVADTGRGIEDDAQARIFDRYWHDGSGARAAGTGLGLSIARGIIEAHDGRIWVESRVGVGTTVRFTLPLAPGLEDEPGAE
jgi:PAS domain S-box-containing protein